jgi:hypothetical protein
LIKVRFTGTGSRDPRLAFLDRALAGSALAAVTAIVWANTFAVGYFQIAQSRAFVVNEVGMAFALAYSILKDWVLGCPCLAGRPV